MAIYKNGIWSANEIHEFNAVQTYNSNTYAYTPTKDATNSCVAGWQVDLTPYSTLGRNVTIRVEVDVEYSGFDNSSTAGTFKMWWQGSNYSIADQAFKWAGTNYLASALGNEKDPTVLVNGTGTGTYHYNNTITIPSSWFNTYLKSNLGLRTDYSNGVGTITLRNLKVYLESEFGQGKAKINNNQNLVVNSFIEI